MPEHRIHTYFSNHTETLCDALLWHLGADDDSPLQDPFQRAQILVPNSGMQRYLELKIASQFGICAHINLNYAGSFLWDMYHCVLGNSPLANVDERLLTFTLLNHWQHQPEHADEALKALLKQHQQPRQRYLFAAKIARLLHQYVNERPDMIDAWQAGKMTCDHTHERWQRDLLLQLINILQLHDVSRNRLQQRFASALTTTAADLPPVVHVFGFHALPAAQLADLFAIGQVSQIRFYTFNPSVAYWQDIVPEATKTKAAMTVADEAALLSVGHPLLASWGQSGKYLIEQLSAFDHDNCDMTESPENADKPNIKPNVLRCLQQSIGALDDSCHALPAAFKAEQQNKHFSISLHAAANARREVEVLYDNLCRRFASDDLNPADVLVIVPKLSDYAPHIQAVFACSSIPYSLANQTSAESDADVQAFLALLSVIEHDFQAQTLFECLHEARIQTALNLSTATLNSLRQWLADSHYSLHFRDSSDGRNSSLEKLLDSLLLAYVGGEHTALANREAADFFHASQHDTLTLFCDLWQRFLPFSGLRTRRLTLTQWLDEFRRLADAFLPWHHGMDARLNAWFEAIAAADTELAYPFATVLTDLSAVLQSDMLHGPFLSGGVSFCAVMPMRSIPAKCIAILGLNADFPVISPKDPLDLRQLRPLWSDKNLHKEQQYFFLETLMAARETLYLSHVGLDEQTGKSIPPSALVNELFGYIERDIPHFGDTVTTHYALQGFSAKDSYQTLYNTLTAEERPAQIPEGDDKTPRQPNKEQLSDGQLTERQLANALHEPLLEYLRHHLGATIDEVNEPLTEHEFIASDSGLARWQYRHTALTLSGNENDITNTLKQKNLLAPPVISDALIVAANEDTEPLQTALYELSPEGAFEKINTLIKFPFAGKNRYLRLRAEHVAGHGLIHYHVGKNNAKKQLQAWVSHVLYHCQKDVEPGASLLLTMDKGKVTRTSFSPLNAHDADKSLTAMLQLLETIRYSPYPVTLEAGKKGENTRFIYRKADYPLLTKIPDIEEEKIAALNALWQSIEDYWQ